MADATPPLRPSVSKAPSSTEDRRHGKAKSSQTSLPNMSRVQGTQKQQTAGKQQGGAIHDPMGRHPQRSQRKDIYLISSRIQVLCRIHMHSNRRKTRRVPRAQESLHQRISQTGDRARSPSKNTKNGSRHRISQQGDDRAPRIQLRKTRSSCCQRTLQQWTS